MLSVIIPAYNEEQNISLAAKTLSELLKNEKILHIIISPTHFVVNKTGY